MSSPNPPADAEAAAKQLEQLLARAIGPMAKIVLGRARKKAHDDAALLKTLAASIDDEGERAAFVTAAERLLEPLRRGGVTRVSLGDATASPAAAPPQPAAAPPEPAPPAPPSRPPAPPPAASTRAASPPAASPPAASAAPAPRDDVMPPGAIFVSYARDNIDVARSIVERLRDAGLDVWLDLGKLQPGDAWDLKIRRNIEGCSFFLALISRETNARPEGYFRREWNLAADRALNFADDVPFLLPVTIDDTPAYSARVPERFRAMHWTVLKDGQATSEFVEYLRQLVQEYRQRHSA